MALELTDLELDRIRTRAFYLSLDETRADRHDADKNWADAVAAEEAHFLSLLDATPRLAGLVKKHAPDLRRAHVGRLMRQLRDEPPVPELGAVEQALEGLSARFSDKDLHAIHEDLVVDADAMQSEARWDRAVTDLYAFDALQRHKCLGSLGWPGAKDEKTLPPFDCSIMLNGITVPCDVKPAFGSGFRQVRDAVLPRVAAWANERGLEDVQTLLSYRGSVVSNGTSSEAELSRLDEQLQLMTEAPSNWVNLRLGGSQFDVIVARPSPPSMFLAPVPPLVSAQLPSFKKHVEAKSKASAAHGGAPFLLGYVMLPGGTASPGLFDDLAKKTASGAMHLGHSAGALWLGAILFDYQSDQPAISLHVRPAADWPAQLSYRTLASALGASISIL